MRECVCGMDRDVAGQALAGGGVASGGLRELIPTVARTAVVCGVQGIFMEVMAALIVTHWQRIDVIEQHHLMTCIFHDPTVVYVWNYRLYEFDGLKPKLDSAMVSGPL